MTNTTRWGPMNTAPKNEAIDICVEYSDGSRSRVTDCTWDEQLQDWMCDVGHFKDLGYTAICFVPVPKCPSKEKPKPMPVVQPLDRSAQVLTSGEAVPADRSHTELQANGQQKSYVVLTPEERAKGFVNPVRNQYVHDTCGVVTRMSHEIAETYARDPFHYNGTFCVGCGAHFPLAEFKWRDGSDMDPMKWTPEERERVRDLLYAGNGRD